MLNIEYIESLNEELYNLIDTEFNNYATKNEVHISDLIIPESYRNKHVGTKLMEAVENYFKDKNFENINLTTYEFQAPEFYKKCGYKVEFIRENKKEPKLTKYFLIKHLD